MAAIRGRTLQRSEPQGPNAVRIRAEDGKRRRETKAGKPVSSHGCSGISYPCGSAPAAEPETNPRTKRVRRIGRRRRGSERDGTKRFSERLGFRPSTPESSPRPAGAAAPPRRTSFRRQRQRPARFGRAATRKRFRPIGDPPPVRTEAKTKAESRPFPPAEYSTGVRPKPVETDARKARPACGSFPLSQANRPDRTDERRTTRRRQSERGCLTSPENRKSPLPEFIPAGVKSLESDLLDSSF